MPMQSVENYEWIHSDELQFVKVLGDNVFEFVEVHEIEPSYYLIYHDVIDVADYDNQAILEVIESFGYEAIEEIQQVYDSQANQIIAECVFELITMEFGNVSAKLRSANDVLLTLKQDYEIELSAALLQNTMDAAA